MTEFDHLTAPRDRQFVSMGFVCGLLQILPGQLKVLMEAGDHGEQINFAQIVDGVGYLDVDAAERIAERCRDVRKEIHSAATSFERN